MDNPLLRVPALWGLGGSEVCKLIPDRLFPTDELVSKLPWRLAPS